MVRYAISNVVFLLFMNLQRLSQSKALQLKAAISNLRNNKSNSRNAICDLVNIKLLNPPQPDKIGGSCAF